MRHHEKLKENNTDINNVLDWVEECSGVNNKQKEILKNLKQANFNSNQKVQNIIIPNSKLNYFSNFLTNPNIVMNEEIKQKLDNIVIEVDTSFIKNDGILYNNYNTNLNYNSDNNYLSINESLVNSIETPEFNIFDLRESIGQSNVLSCVSCYIFITESLFSLINYTNFEFFIDKIASGYSKNNKYHNDLHAADVVQTCYVYLKFGRLKEVN